ncbi:hypothetical protein GCM10010525_06290 [Glutamicibacter bergerei]
MARHYDRLSYHFVTLDLRTDSNLCSNYAKNMGYLRGMEHAVVIWTRPYPEIPTATDRHRIWVDPKLTTPELRCVLAHEAIHSPLPSNARCA